MRQTTAPPFVRGMIAGFAFVTASLLSGCGSMELTSRWTPTPLTVDGELTHWPDSTWADKDGVRFSVVNDSSNCYVEVVIVKPELRRQVMTRGLTLWFDPLGRQKKSVGIRYPIGLSGEGAGYRRDQSMAQSSLAASQAEFEYISPLQPDRMRVPVVAAKGISIRINNTDEAMVYELKAPLHTSSDHPYSIESVSGSKIGIGVEIGGAARPAGGEREEGEGDGGGGFGGGRRGGGGRGRGGGSNRPGGTASLQPVEVWATVQLAPQSK